nr:anti-sigma factor [Cellulomonas sp. JH27-2]
MHVSDDVLALLALGEQAGTDAERAHVAGCALCTDEVASLADVVGLARDGDAALVPPSAQVWDRVAAELGLATTGAPVTETAATPEHTPSRLATDPVVLVPRRRRPRSWGWIAGAAAAGLVIGGIGVGWALTRDDRSASVVASATLEPLPGWDASGSAKVETQRDGTRVLVVDVDEAHLEDGFREVWLLTPDVKGLVSIGTLDGTSGRFDLPAGLDLDEYSVVDVSQEPFDGNPAHSGDSIVRGALRI